MKVALFSPELAPKVFGKVDLDLFHDLKTVKTERKTMRKVTKKDPKLYNLHMKELVKLPKGF